MKNNNNKKSGIFAIGKVLTRNEMKSINGGGIIVGGDESKVCSFICKPCEGYGNGNNCKTDGTCC